MTENMFKMANIIAVAVTMEMGKDDLHVCKCIDIMTIDEIIEYFTIIGEHNDIHVLSHDTNDLIQVMRNIEKCVNLDAGQLIFDHSKVNEQCCAVTFFFQSIAQSIRQENSKHIKKG